MITIFEIHNPYGFVLYFQMNYSWIYVCIDTERISFTGKVPEGNILFEKDNFCNFILRSQFNIVQTFKGRLTFLGFDLLYLELLSVTN